MIHKSQAKPPQFNYWHLGKGYYLTKDPIGDVMIPNLWRLFHGIRCQINYKSIVKQYPNLKGCPHPNELWHRWDDFYRVKLQIPYKI